MTSLEDLIAAFQAHELKLPALFDALNERGAVSDEQHEHDIAWLEQQRDEGDLDPLVVRALVAKLGILQPVAPPDPVHQEAADEDVTQVHVQRPAADEGHDAGPGQAPPDAADGTIFKARPADASGGDDAATVVRPASHSTGTGSTGLTGTNTSTWKRVAAESGGEYATVGMLLKGRFLLERELGRGGMGVVYLARDERKVEARDRDPYVAVKVLNDEFRRHPDSLIALQREARRSQQLAHDNIVRVYDFDKDRTIVFMTMEYIEGTNLKTLIREEAFDGMPLAKALPLINGMAQALGRAHAAGVVHSDFKPGNVMVTTHGAPKVFDFGIARAGKFVGESGEVTVFDAGTLGALTPAYASLEMLQGAEPAPFDDIYALGCVVYELLTGKHPFDKVSAEVVLKEGRKPPHVPGLTRRQNRTLAAAVALHAEQRLKNVQGLIDGLREVSFGERARPFLIYGAVVVVALAVAAWGTHRYLEVRHVDQVVGRFTLTNPDHYANESQAYKALTALGENESKRVVVDHSSVIEKYFLERLDTYWDPTRKHYDYAGVQHVFQVRDKLKLYSPDLDVRRQAIEQQRNTLLNTLDTQLSQRIDAGAIFRNQPDNVVATLAVIRAINPHSPLLHNAELALKYDVAIGKTLDAGDLDKATQQLALAQHLFPRSKRLAHRAQQLASVKQAHAATQKVASTHLGIPQARKMLGQLLDKPSLRPRWRMAVAGALHVLHGDHAAATTTVRKRLAGVITVQAAQAKEPTQVQHASDLVALGLSYAPDSKPLLAQQSRLAILMQQHQAVLAHESAMAEVSTRIESLKRAAAAHDIDKAGESLARIRKLDPGNAFLTRKGPQLVAAAYLGQARSLADHDKYRLAAGTLSKGMQVLGKRADLSHAHDRLMFVADLMRARKRRLSSAAIQHLRERLATLRRRDSTGLASLQKAMKLHGALPEGSFTQLIQALKPGEMPAPASPPAQVTPTPTAPGIASAGSAVAAVGTQPGVIAAPAHAPATPQPSVASKTPTSRMGAQPAAHKAPVASLPTASADPCARTGLAGSGRICEDHIGTFRGPAMVVIPDRGGKRYALSRTEITVREFDRYCRASHQCKAAGGVASLPVTNISLHQAKAYAAWLSKRTGQAYRLPTNAEWMHAAKAGQGWNQSPDSNCVPPSGDGGTGGPISARGRQPNPWGLVNMTGNVWEWVTQGQQTMIRGGAYDSYWSECTVTSHRSDTGKPRSDVGFRVLRGVQ